MRHVLSPGRRLAAVLAALSCMPLVASSAQGRDTVVLAPVVVTSTRMPVASAAVAASVTVLTGDELRARGIRTVAQALRATPAASVVETAGPGGQTALFLRGGESDYVKVLLDGVPLNQPGGAFDFADLTTDNVERIEIVRGPGSVLYGSDAVTGVIQIFTRRGRGRPRVGAEARAGTYGTAEVAADVVGGGERAGYALRVARHASDGVYPYNNHYRNAVGSVRLRVAPDPRTAASLVYHWGDATYHFPTDGAGRPVDSNQFSARRGPAASLELERSLGRGVELRALGTLREARQRFADPPDSPAEDGAFQSRDLVRRASAAALVSWRVRGVALVAGVEYEDQRQRGRSEFAASFGRFPDSVDVRRWNAGYFAQAWLGSAGPLALSLGARLDDNSQFGGHTTVRAGATYRVDAATQLRASAGTGFKEPTFFENFARGFVTGNPDLAPERARGWEVGLEHALAGDRVRLAVTYFAQRFRDLIEFTFTPAPPDSVNYFNVAGASADGVEASVQAALPHGIAATLAYTYLDSRARSPGFDTGPDALFTPGRRLLRRPAHSLTHELSGPVGRRGHAALTVRLTGERDDLDFARPPGERRVTLRPHARVDLAAQWVVLRDGWGGAGVVLTARVENLLDDGAQEVAGFRPRRRTIVVGGRASLGS